MSIRDSKKLDLTALGMRPGSNRFNHHSVINQIMKTIELCDLHNELKMILRMRLWGVNPDYFDPLTVEKIAQLTKKPVKLIKNYEKEAVKQLEAYLKSNGMIEVVSKFNFDPSNRRKLKTSIIYPNENSRTFIGLVNKTGKPLV